MARRLVANNNMRAVAMALVAGLAAPSVVVVMETPAHAANNEQTLAPALAKFEEGRKAYEAGQFDVALPAFQASIAMLPSPNTRLYIGRCFRALGKTASAYTTLKLAASEAQDRLTATGEKRYGASRDTATQEANDLEPKVPRLTVAVPGGLPAGFSIKVNGVELPPGAWGIATETDPGEVTVEATGHRVQPFKSTVKLAEGARARVDVSLPRIPTATIALSFKSLPAGLSVSFDGQPVDPTTAATPREVDVGKHAVTVTAPGYKQFQWNMALADNASVHVDVTLAVDNHTGGGGGHAGTPKWMFFTSAGLAVAAAATGTAIGLSAQSQQNAELAKDVYDRSASTQNSIKSQAMLTDVLFAGAGVFAAGAVVLAFTTNWKGGGDTTSASLSVAPWMGAGTAGIGAHGEF